MRLIWKSILAIVIVNSAAERTFAAEMKFDTLAAGSQTYSNVVVTGQTPVVLYIQHAKGVGSVKLKDLDPALQKQFGFDPVKAAEIEKRQQQNQTDYVNALAKQSPPRPGPSARGSESNPNKPPLNADSFLNQPGPDVFYEKWISDLPDVKGKFVLLEFWEASSAPCRRSIPRLNELHRTYSDRLIVMGLSDEPEESVRKMTDPRIEYYSAIDPKQRTSRMAGVRAVPHVLLMDPLGIVRFEGHPSALSDEELQRILTQFAN